MTRVKDSWLGSAYLFAERIRCTSRLQRGKGQSNQCWRLTRHQSQCHVGNRVRLQRTPGSYQVCVQLIMPNKSIACTRPRLASRAKIGSIFISRPVTVSTIARCSRTIVLRFAGGRVVKFSTLRHRSDDTLGVMG